MAKMKKEKNMGHDMHSCLNKKVNCRITKLKLIRYRESIRFVELAKWKPNKPFSWLVVLQSFFFYQSKHF